MFGERPSSWPRVSTTWLRRQVQLLHAPWGPDRPAPVAEVTLQLADDGGGGVGRELDAEARVEAVDRFQQTERRHLDQVVEGLTPVGEAAGQVGGQAHVGRDQLVAQHDVAGAGVRGEHLPQGVAVSHRARAGLSVCRLTRRNLGPVRARARAECSSTRALRITRDSSVRRDRRHVVDEMTLPFDHQTVVAEDVAQLDRARPPGRAGQPEAQLVDGEAQILDLVVAEAERPARPAAVTRARRRNSGKAGTTSRTSSLAATTCGP